MGVQEHGFEQALAYARALARLVHLEVEHTEWVQLFPAVPQVVEEFFVADLDEALRGLTAVEEVYDVSRTPEFVCARDRHWQFLCQLTVYSKGVENII